MHNTIIISTKGVSFFNADPSITTTPCALCFEDAANGKNLGMISRASNESWGQTHDGVVCNQCVSTLMLGGSAGLLNRLKQRQQALIVEFEADGREEWGEVDQIEALLETEPPLTFVLR